MKDQASKKAKSEGRRAKEPVSQEPLSDEESKALHSLISEAEKANHELVHKGCELQYLRLRLKTAERDFAAARCAVANIHGQIAPLLHRLPTA